MIEGTCVGIAEGPVVGATVGPTVGAVVVGLDVGLPVLHSSSDLYRNQASFDPKCIG